MDNQIFIDGQDFTGDVNGVNDLVISFGLDSSTRTVNTSVTSGLIFIGDAFNYLKGKFFGDGVGFEGRDLESDIVIRINKPECQTEYNFLIRGDLLEICFTSCTITSRGFTRTADQEASNKMTYTEITFNSFVEIKVCYEFTFVNALVLSVVNSLLLIFAPIAVILQNLGAPAFVELLTDLQQEAAGCEPSDTIFTPEASNVGASINDYLTTSLDAVGLSFSSSIVQSGYYANSVYLPRGFPRPTIRKFLEEISILFNADYRILNGTLYFERKDFFFDNTNLLVDVDEVSTSTNPVCYIFTPNPNFGAATFSFGEDNRETAGNEALGDYKDTVLYNDPELLIRKDINDVIIPFGAVKFTGDRYDTNILLQNGERPVGRMIVSRNKVPYSFPKVVMVASLDGDFGTFDAKVVNTTINGEVYYNYPFYIGQDNDLVPSIEDEELYQNFYFIDDPRVTPVAPYEITDYTFKATSEQINLVRNNGIDVYVQTRFGKGFPTEIDINYENGTITIKDVKIVDI